MASDEWRRRRDLEGGKQVLVWVRESRDEELVVEDHTYYGGGYRIYRHDLAADSRERIGTYAGPEEATDRAIAELARR